VFYKGRDIVTKKKPKMLFALVYPNLYRDYKADKRTEDYLKRMKETLSLKEIVHKWEETVFPVEQHYSLFKSRDCEGIAHIGRRGGSWIAQVSLIKGIHYFDVVRYVFEKNPTPETILQANILNQIYAYFHSKKGTEYYICNECGRRLHWLDNDGNIEIKWEHLKEQDCGC